MELQLTRQDYIQVNSCSHRDTMAVLPYGKHKRQYVTIGDDTGELLAFGIKRGEKKIIFKSLVDCEERKIVKLGDKSSANVKSTEVTALSLSGKDGDKIFLSTENDVYGVKRSKGNMFQHFNSNMTETIENLKVLGNVGQRQQYWTSGEYVFSMHEENDDGSNELFNERVFYSCQDKINDFDIKKYTIKYDSKKAGILGCNDGTIRKIDGNDMSAEVNVKKSVTKIVVPKVLANASSESGSIILNQENYLSSNDVVFGTRRGNMGSITFDANNNAKKLWNIKGTNKSTGSTKRKREAAITCIKMFDITKDGINDYIVGREDGTLQVYAKDDVDTKPFLQFRSSVEENIRTLTTGVVSTPGNDEIIINTFSGRVLSFTTESLSEKAEGDKYGRSKRAIAKEATLNGLKSDLKDLKKQVEKETKTLKKEMGVVRKSKDEGIQAYSTIQSMDTQFKVKVFFDLLQDDAAYKLAVECSSPIEQVLLKSDIPVDIMDIEDNDAIVSVTNNVNSHEHGPQPILATFRNDQILERSSTQSQRNDTETKKDSDQATYNIRGTNRITSKRMELKVRTVEGQSGAITLYIIASHNNSSNSAKDEIKIRQTAHCVTIGVVPLSLHCRAEKPKLPLNKMPLNVLELKGYSSLNQAHEWLRNILPNFPRRTMAYDQDRQTFFYENSLVGSLLAIEYEYDKILMSSDSISTISILKESINKLAMSANVRISLSIRINEMSVVRFLALAEPKLQEQLGLATKIKWLDALSEVTGGGNPEYLSDELRDVLKNSKQIRCDYKQSAKIIQFWYGVITDLYIDLNRCRGINASHNIPKLMHALENFNMDNILKFFGVEREDIGRHFEELEKEKQHIKNMEKKARKEQKRKERMERERKALNNTNSSNEKQSSIDGFETGNDLMKINDKVANSNDTGAGIDATTISKKK
jgi:Bardet-Biedl syndrome 7 protein